MAGLDYPGVSPLHCFKDATRRTTYIYESDESALSAYKLIRKLKLK